MKTSSVALTLLFASSSTINAFAPTTRSSSTKIAFGAKHHQPLKMAATSDDEVAKLRAAAAKAREDANRLSEELGKTVPVKEAPAAVVAKESLSLDQVTALMSDVKFEGGDAASQSTGLDTLKQSGDLQLWKAASDNLRTFPVSLNFLEQRTSGKITGDSLGISGEDDVSLDDFKYATLGITLGASVLAVAALAFLPENVGAAVCYGFASLPILWLGVGSSAPGILAGAIASAKGTADDNEQRFDRICRHEAGHFLCGYLYGLPIKGYEMAEDTGVACVEFHPSTEGPATGRELKQEEIAALSVVAMSGSVAEVLGLGVAKGGANDLIELNGLFRRSKEFIGAQKQQDLTRWGALTAYQLLDQNKEKYEQLVAAFKGQKSVQECIAILESR